MSASTFTAGPPTWCGVVASLVRGGGGVGGLLLTHGVERHGLRRRARLADAHQRVERGQAALPGAEVGVEVGRRDRADLEVHERVIGAAELGAAAHVGALL